MADHPVKVALRRDVLPYLVSARHLKKQWYYRLHLLFGYTTDIVAGLAAIGVAFPLLSTLGYLSASDSDPAKAPSLAAALSGLPGWISYPAAAIVLCWVVLRVAFNREEGQKRAVLAKSCTRSLRQAEASLAGILSQQEPMPGITQLLEKHIRPSVDRNIQEDAWPWTPFASGIEATIDSNLGMLCARYEATGTIPTDPVLRQ